MRFFLKFSLLLALIIFTSSIILPRRYGFAIPRPPGPALDKQIRFNYLEDVETLRPEIVLMGDSTLGASTNVDELARQTGQSMYQIGIPGSASALWYLILKNDLAPATYHPKYLIVVFRNSLLTAPGYRVHGSYFDLLDEYADREEPLLLQNSYLNFMNPLEVLAEEYLPLYVARSNVRQAIDRHVRYFSPALFGCNQNCTDLALAELFQGADFEPQALTDAIGAAESYLYTPERLDFADQVGKSYLPEMIRMAQENNIQLIFVRVKVKTNADDPRVAAYVNDLADYLSQNHAILLDYGADARLTSDLFLDAIHLNAKGREVFTPILAQDLKILLAGE
ncbi:MAG: hypothetical protein IT310_07920 [Anaerolineales bacterium]|nr:hypothetical protein [Anaerolineales bacterium]